jgi:broad-specificity NMP kinase
MSRYYYRKDIPGFVTEPTPSILGELVKKHEFALEEQQRNAWVAQIELLKTYLGHTTGEIIFEYTIPRMGKRIDCVIITGAAILAIEFKIGAQSYDSHAINQAMDYALDLKNFHEQSHHQPIIPVLICTEAEDHTAPFAFYADGIAKVMLSNGTSLANLILNAQSISHTQPIAVDSWINSIYKPTPSIIEAAQALYEGHSVEEISRSDAGAINLTKTAKAITEIINHSKLKGIKSICFLTGVPGAGKTLAGLNLANSWYNPDENEHAVFLSGNGPLVEVLREALARNEIENAHIHGKKKQKNEALSKAKAFIQNIHHFRDDALDRDEPPLERVVVFDEAQRAWTLKQTASFMKIKKGKNNFSQSEPEFLISVMDKHKSWATIICLIGGGQEINTGEAGIQEWFSALKRAFPKWHIHLSNKLTELEYTNGTTLYDTKDLKHVYLHDDLHLAVSIRSFRSEKVAALVKVILDCNTEAAQQLYAEVKGTYPIYISRNISSAKAWLSSKARGTERYGLLASSGAIRLKPFAIHVKNKIDPINWFLNGEKDIRSSCFLEDVATEFDVQGLELDWTCVAWDADLRYNGKEWLYKSFKGSKWQTVKGEDAKRYLKNAYRVLLTRARQGMVIFVPHGSDKDSTREPCFYDETYKYLTSLGIEELR